MAIASNRAVRIAAVAVAVPVAAVATFTIVTHALWHRSNMGTFSEWYHRTKGTSDKLSDGVLFDNLLLKRADANEQPYSIPTLQQPKVSIEERSTNDGSQVFVLNRRGINDRAIVYLYGSTYINRPKPEHWKFLDTLARKTRAEILVPMYPLAPRHTFTEAFATVEETYRRTIDKYGAENVILMGDGAGGGLAAGFAGQMGVLGLPQPKKLILISPWVDASLNNPQVEAYAAVDPMLAVRGMRKAAKLWSGGVDLADPRLSPINGSVRELSDVIVFVGTRELLYPDVKLYFDRVHAAGIPSELHVGRGLNHMYPLYPTPEATRAMDEIVAAVTED